MDTNPQTALNPGANCFIPRANSRETATYKATSDHTCDDTDDYFDCYIPAATKNDTVVFTTVTNTRTEFTDETQPVKLGPTPEQYAPTKARIWPHIVGKLWKECPEYALLYSTVRDTALPNHRKARITVPSGLNLEKWEANLTDYHDTQLCSYLRYGWPVGYTAVAPPMGADSNHSSADEHPDQLKKFVDEELKLGGLLGPFSGPPFTPWVNLAPLLTQPKKDSTNRRVIMDLSWPESGSVNSGITKNCMEGYYKKYTLPSVQDLVTHLKIVGPGAYMWKADLARAYRQLRVDPADIPLLGFRIGQDYYLDKCPSFGARLSGSACQRTTTAVTYLMRKAGYTTLVYLDDFCGIEATQDKAQQAYHAFLDLAAELGLQLATHKCMPPAPAMEWLGFDLDAPAMIISVPGSKLSEILEDCQRWERRKTATKKDLQSIAGKLVHISRCVTPARRFICRILECIRKAPDSGSVSVPPSVKADIRWFGAYAKASNGVHLLDPDLKEYAVECDSTMQAGGGHSNTHYYTYPYTAVEKKRCSHITQHEATNLLVAYRTLAPHYSIGMRIILYTDNMSSKQALQSGRARDPVLAACSRQMWLEAALKDQVFEIRHKPGVDIPLADALSRYKDLDKRAYADKEIAKRGLKELLPVIPDLFFTNI